MPNNNYDQESTKKSTEPKKPSIETVIQSIEDLGGPATHDLSGARQDQIAEIQRFKLSDSDVIPQDGLAIIVRGYDKPITVEKVQRIVLGRDVRASDFSRVIDLAAYDAMDKGVSRKHAMLASVSGIYYLNDMASTNGTWLNGSRLVAFRSHELKPGDWVKLGNLEIRIYFKPAQEILTINLIPKQESEDESLLMFTPQYLAQTVAPFLETVDTIQKILDEITETPMTEIVLRHISGPPLTISMANGAQAVKVIREHFGPWEAALTQETPLEKAQRELAQAMIDTIKLDVPKDLKQTAIERLIPCINLLMHSGLKLSEEKLKQIR